MTTVIGIKCTDGIIIASDSQATSPSMKNMEESKIFKISDSICIGASGDIRHIKILVEKLKKDIGELVYNNESQIRDCIYESLLSLHKFYNVDRSFRLGYKETKLFFQPSALLAVKIPDMTFCLYYIGSDLWLDVIDNYQTIGSGSILANLVLTQQSRIPKLNNEKFSDRMVEQNIWTSIITINEVKAIEPKTGGDTKIITITKEGLTEISNEHQSEIYKNTVHNTAKILGQRLFGNDQYINEFK
ncbi:MAG: hypothetical protein L0H53_10530, partial [Candidatus Nitrosocosmicus sp.]|nr:hypothetical protein [Candidatus Nitrosocosmicus sp.]